MGVESFGKAKAEKTGDCRNWTVADALKAALEEVESGVLNPDMVYIAFRESDDGNGTKRYEYIIAGMTSFDVAGLLTKHLFADLHQVHAGE